MFLSLDNYLSVHSTSVTLRAQRASILANNLANSDTPGFKSRDISFKESLASVTDHTRQTPVSAPQSTHPAHFPIATPTRTNLLYRVPIQVSLDGNTVDSDVEKSIFTENSVRYEASLRFLSGKISGLIKALRGE